MTKSVWIFAALLVLFIGGLAVGQLSSTSNTATVGPAVNPQGVQITPLPIYGPGDGTKSGVPAQNSITLSCINPANPPVAIKGQAVPCQTDINGNILFRQLLAPPPSQANIADATGLRPVYGPCLYLARQPFVINNLSSNTLVVTGSANKKIAICDYYIAPVAAAANVELVEGTGATCGTNTVGLQGGNTAALGANLATNGGFVQAANPNGDPWGITANQGDSICIYPSAAVQGVINFVGPF